MLLSDLYGIESHGVQRLVRYHKGIANGLIRVGAKSKSFTGPPVSAVIDGHDGMGQLISIDAMIPSIKKARKAGLRLSRSGTPTPLRIAGYYAKMASDHQGLIGLAMTNSEAIMVLPTYSRLAMLGSNPIAMAIAGRTLYLPVRRVTTVVTGGSSKVCNKLSKPLPEGMEAGPERQRLHRRRAGLKHRRQGGRRYHAARQQYRADGRTQGLQLRDDLRNLLLHILWRAYISTTPIWPAGRFTMALWR